MRSRYTAYVPVISLLFAAPCTADLNLSGNFDPPDLWQPHIPGPGFATQNFSGGNPGGHMSVSPWLGGFELNASTAGAVRSPSVLLFLSPELTHIVIDADVRYLSGQWEGRLVPLLVQSGRTFIPAAAGELISASTWTRSATRVYPLDSFVQVNVPTGSTTLPFTPTQPVNIGFAVRLSGTFGLGPPTSEYAVDNINLRVVPGPAALPALVIGMALTRRRRARQPA